MLAGEILVQRGRRRKRRIFCRQTQAAITRAARAPYKVRDRFRRLQSSRHTLQNAHKLTTSQRRFKRVYAKQCRRRRRCRLRRRRNSRQQSGNSKWVLLICRTLKKYATTMRSTVYVGYIYKNKLNKLNKRRNACENDAKQNKNTNQKILADRQKINKRSQTMTIEACRYKLRACAR